MTMERHVSAKAVALYWMLPVICHATTWQDIADLEADKAATHIQMLQLPSHIRWLTLSNGTRINLHNWKVVVFLSSTCSFCHQYDPMIQKMANRIGISLLSYSLDGKGDHTFPYPLTPTPEVLARFFGQSIPIATPTTFLVNVNTLTTFPLLQGNQSSFLSRLDDVFQVAVKGGLR